MFKREQLLSEHVPVEDHVTGRAVLLSDGSAYALFCCEGVPWETADPADINASHERWNLTLRNVASDRLILTTHQCRGLADPGGYPGGTFRSGFAEALDLAYRDRLFDRTLYGNRLLLGVQIRPAHPAGEWLGRRARRRKVASVDGIDDRVRRLEEVCELLAADLATYKPRRLGLVQRGAAVFSEIGEALVFAATGVWRPVGLSTGRLGNVMFSEDMTFGHEAIELRGPGSTGFAAMLGLREYPAITWPGQFDRLLAAPYRYTLTQSFRFLGKAEGEAVLTRKQNKMVWGGDKAVSQLAGLTQAADQLASNAFVMGEHNFSLCVFADGLRALDDAATAAWKDLADSGAVVARETKALMASWLSQLPGNHRLRVRPGAISSRNYAAMAALHGYPPGAQRGHWGEPIALFRTAGGTPYRFHLHVGDLGNTFVSGRAGSGKTTWLGFVITQAEKAGAQVVLWDKDRGLEILVRAVAGTYVRLRNGEPCVAPLKALNGGDPGDMAFLAALARGAIMHRGGPELSPEEDRRLALGLTTVMEAPPEERSWGEVRAFLGNDGNGAGARLERWCWGHELGWVMDGPRHQVTLDAPVLGFDQTEILDNPDARGPILSTLFHLCERLVDGRRLLLVIDEFWKSLLDPAFEALVNDKLKTLRKRNSPMILSTQSPRDALRSSIAHTIREQCPSQVYFANPSAAWEDYGEGGMKRSRAEFDIVRTLPQGSGLFLLCQGPSSVVAQLPLAGLEDEIAVLSGRESTVRLLDEMPGSVLADPGKMLGTLHAQRRQMTEMA